ncbi:MAG: glycosyltransferase family 2 protein [Anaerolineales bacterium]|jgi:glycosyltransferase involved in cell wall biosynthesis
MATLDHPKEITADPQLGLIDVSVVIPVYNEKDNLEPLHRELTEVLTSLTVTYEIVFVDDGSTDGSFDVLAALQKADDRVRVIQFRRNFGQTSAFSAGFEYAHGNLIFTMDADGQNDPADIPRLLETKQQGEYDLVTGWRKNRKESAVRKLLSGTANRLISRSTNIVVHDRGCSLKVFDAELAKNMRLYGQLHRFMPEIASSIGAKVGEIPVNDRSRMHGTSKYGAITRTPRVILDMITVFYLLTYFSSPMRFFGYLALITGGLGVLIGGGLGLAKIYNGIVGGWAGFHAYQIGNRPLLLLAGLMIMVAVQFLMMGLLGEMIMRTYYEAQNKTPYAVRRVLEAAPKK